MRWLILAQFVLGVLYRAYGTVAKPTAEARFGALVGAALSVVSSIWLWWWSGLFG